jgi:hypothetical protein
MILSRVLYRGMACSHDANYICPATDLVFVSECIAVIIPKPEGAVLG